MAQAVPGPSRIVLLASRYAEIEDRLGRARQFATALGIELTVVRAQNSADYNAVFRDIAKAGAAALVVGSSPVFFRDAGDLAARAANVGLPILCEWREMAERGCTFAYGPDVQSMYRTVGRYVARLKGEKPSDLPIAGRTHGPGGAWGQADECLLASRYADEDRLGRARQFATALGIELTVVRAQNSADYNAVFRDIAKAGAAALVVGSSPVFLPRCWRPRRACRECGLTDPL